MDFAALPPEINSARMYSGPGPGSLLAAAGSWDGLSAELRSTAQTYESVISGLTSWQWLGPASTSMMAAATPYVDWLTMTAMQTELAASQARAAALAFEDALAMTVPPPVIVANRALLTSLIASNFFGQNTSAIAAAEADYAEMWAQDAAAMYDYAATAAAAARLALFSEPPQTTNLAGLAGQATAAIQSAAGSAGAKLTSLSHLLSAVPQALHSLTLPGSLPPWLQNILNFFDTGHIPADLLDIITLLDNTIDIINMPTSSMIALVAIMQSLATTAGAEATVGAEGAASGLETALAPIISALDSMSLAGPAAAAALGGAGFIGPLAVPPAWAAPAAAGHVAALSGAGLTTLPGTTEAGMPGVPGVPLGAMARPSGVIPRYGVRLTVMPRPPMGG